MSYMRWGERTAGTPVTPGELRAGDTVRLRPVADILATLDECASFEGVPFMPEMAQYAGKTLTVYKRLEKICDYYAEGSRSRRMTDAVLLQETRCDGSAHGGCQAECRIFWKEIWLEHDTPDAPTSQITGLGVLLERTAPHAVKTVPGSTETLYRCQATEAASATSPIPEKAPGQYVREVRVGNVSAWDLLRVAVSTLTLKVARKLGLRSYLPLEVAGDDRVDGPKLGLQPGEWVRVRSKDEIGKTLNEAAAHRGLVFAHEMAHWIGNTYRVRARVERLVEEKTGRLLQMKSDCISLDGCVCSGRHASGAWFCPREHFALWREDWLERVDSTSSCPVAQRVDTSPRRAEARKSSSSRT